MSVSKRSHEPEEIHYGPEVIAEVEARYAWMKKLARPDSGKANTHIESILIGDAASKPDDRLTHGKDFAWVRCPRGEFEFTPAQRHVIGALVEDLRAGGLGVGQAYLIGVSGSQSERLRDLFRNHPAWGTLIVHGNTRDTFRLDPGNS
jgi:hypothetical protein